MATENPGIPQSRIAGTNVTNKRFVVEAAGGIVNRCTASNVMPTGVVAMISTGVTGTTITAGDEAPVVMMGGGKVVIMESGAAVADNAEVMSDTVGRAITAATTGNYKAGRVVNGTSASAAGQDIAVLLYGNPVIII